MQPRTVGTNGGIISQAALRKLTKAVHKLQNKTIVWGMTSFSINILVPNSIRILSPRLRRALDQV